MAIQWNRFRTTYSVAMPAVKAAFSEYDFLWNRLEFFKSNKSTLEMAGLRFTYSDEDKYHLKIITGMEAMWFQDFKPFYRVWPSMVAGLRGLDLSRVPMSVIKMPHNVISIEPVGPNEKPFLLYWTSHLCAVYISHPEKPGECKLEKADFSDCATFGDVLERCDPDPNCEERKALALGVAIALMNADPTIITPLLCSRYDGRLDPNGDLHRKSAKKMGGLGYDVGKHVESAPHFRRPHPALRWTGPGKTIPKIVMVKGSLVKRKEATKVPTGYRISLERGEAR